MLLDRLSSYERFAVVLKTSVMVMVPLMTDVSNCVNERLRVQKTKDQEMEQSTK